MKPGFTSPLTIALIIVAIFCVAIPPLAMVIGLIAIPVHISYSRRFSRPRAEAQRKAEERAEEKWLSDTLAF